MRSVHAHLGACLLAALVLTACHARPKTAPDTAVMHLPPPKAGQAALYAAPDGVSVQARLEGHPGDCDKKTCFVFMKNRWRPLPAGRVRELPLLTLGGASGSAYSESLWREAGPARGILLNDSAARDAVRRGQFDGLRIGLRDHGHTSYVTLFNADSANIALSGGGAWLLLPRPDGSSDLVELFGLMNRSTVTCMGKAAIDASPWAGPVEKALSPDVFIARDIPAASRTAEKTRVTQACSHYDADLKRQP